MKPTERQKRLNEIVDLLKTIFNSNDKYNGLSASFFQSCQRNLHSPHYFSTADQGIKISYAGNDSSVLADVLGFIRLRQEKATIFSGCHELAKNFVNKSK